MEIRNLTPEDYVQHNKVASQSFIYECDIYEDKLLPCETMLGAFENGVLAADMEVYDRLCHFDGSILRCAAVGGVASKPEYRNKGAVRQLFEALFSGKHIDYKPEISILYPFSEGYYRKFGYGSTGYSVCLTVPFTELSEMPKNTDVVLFEGENEMELLGLYNAASAQGGLSFLRADCRDFSCEPYAKAEYTYIHKDKNGGYDAYATFSVDRKSSRVNVKEMHFISPDGLRGILGFLRSYEGNQSEITFCALPENSPVFPLLKGAVHYRCTRSCAGAVRILDVASVLEKKLYPVGKGFFAIEITDGDVPANNGVFTVEYSRGTAEVKRTKTVSPDITLTPCAASSLIFAGTANAQSLFYMPGVTVHRSNPALIEAFPVSYPFFTDSF